MKKSVTALGALMLLVAPAAAHVGEHGGMTLSQLASHVFETDHIVFAAIAIVVGILSYRAGRRAEARAIAVRRKDDRS